MKNIINDIDTLVIDSISGFCSAHPHLVQCQQSPLFITRTQKAKNKVAIVSGGGSGHEPLHIGSIGIGMLDAVCPGQLLTSPTPDQILAAINSVTNKEGILLIVKNYQGDKMNFEIAKTMADTNIEIAFVNDDAIFTDRSNARGLAGTVIVEKIVGAAAEEKEPLHALKELADDVNNRTRTIGFALTPLTLPLANEPTYELAAHEMEYGVGIHGEKGHKRIPLLSAKELAEKTVNDIIKSLPEDIGKEILLFINGLGGTPSLELYLMYKEVSEYIQSLGYKVVRTLVGNYATSLNMEGCSVTVTIMNEKIQNYWDQEVKTVNFNW